MSCTLKVVSFDIAGTLLDHSYFDYVWTEALPLLYALRERMSFNEAKEYVLREYDRLGSSDIRWYLPEYWFKRFNLGEDPLDFFTMHLDKIRVYPEASSVLEKLCRRYRLITASGIPRNLQERILEKLPRSFTHLFSSISDLQEVKKTTSFYKMICTVLRVEAEEIVHVGDDWHSDFLIPRKIGIQSVFLDRNKKRRGQFVIRNLSELEKLLNTGLVD